MPKRRSVAWLKSSPTPPSTRTFPSGTMKTRFSVRLKEIVLIPPFQETIFKFFSHLPKQPLTVTHFTIFEYVYFSWHRRCPTNWTTPSSTIPTWRPTSCCRLTCPECSWVLSCSLTLRKSWARLPICRFEDERAVPRDWNSFDLRLCP